MSLIGPGLDRAENINNHEDEIHPRQVGLHLWFSEPLDCLKAPTRLVIIIVEKQGYFSLGVSHHKQKQACENLGSIGHQSCEAMVNEKHPCWTTMMCVLSDRNTRPS